MPIVNAPLPPAAATLQSEGQHRTATATQAPDLNDTLAQGMREQQSTVVRGSDPVQKTGETMVDNNATKRQDSAQHQDGGTAGDTQTDGDDDEAPVRYVKRLSPPGHTQAQSSVSVLVEGYEDSVARTLDINA